MLKRHWRWFGYSALALSVVATGCTNRDDDAEARISASSSLGGGPTNVSVNANGRFAINGNETFLLGVSYYDGPNWHGSDLDALASKKFNLIRIFLDDVLRNNDNSLFEPDGSLRADKKDKIQALIEAAGARGMVVDVSILYADIDGYNSAEYLTSRQSREAAIANSIAAFAGNTNVFFDILNEHNYGSCCRNGSDMGRYMAVARAAGPSSILFYSSSDNIGQEDDAFVFTTRSGAEVDTRNVDAMLANGVNVIAPHNDRQPGWQVLTGARAAALRSHLDATGHNSVPVYFQEDARDLDGAGDYRYTAVACKNAGCASWVFHTKAGFDMSGGSWASHLTDVERDAFDTLGDAVFGSGGSKGGSGGGGSGGMTGGSENTGTPSIACDRAPGSAYYCSQCGGCPSGVGDCDSDADCKPGLKCVFNVGAEHGYDAWVDVCR